MELRYYLKLIRQRLLVVVLTPLLAAALAFGLTSRTAMYTAQTSVFTGTDIGSTNASRNGISYDIISAFKQLTVTFAAMINSRPVISQALTSTNAPRSLDSVLAHTSASQVQDTQLIRVSVTDQDPRIAQDLANAISDAFVPQAQTLVSPTRVQAGALAR
ncbi:MAG: YveK family protein, partial [Acidimicrobiales bacterium]